MCRKEGVFQLCFEVLMVSDLQLRWSHVSYSLGQWKSKARKLSYRENSLQRLMKFIKKTTQSWLQYNYSFSVTILQEFDGIYLWWENGVFQETSGFPFTFIFLKDFLEWILEMQYIKFALSLIVSLYLPLSLPSIIIQKMYFDKTLPTQKIVSV